MPRYQVTYDFWAEDDQKAHGIAAVLYGEIRNEQEPFPDYVEDEGLAVTRIDQHGPIGVRPVEPNATFANRRGE